MQRIINGKRYDTKIAEMVCDVSPNYNSTDFRYEDTQLYRTKNGRWFLAGNGGPRSRWYHDTGNGYSSGDGLVVIEASHARELLEQHDALDALEKHFAVEEA